MTKLGGALRGLGEFGGGALGGLFGLGDAGRSAGNSIGAAMSRWLGSGDYTLSNNTLVKGSNAVPMMHATGQSIVVRHREYIGDVVCGASGAPSTTFDTQFVLPLNPGLETTFPWLSTIAQQYQQYAWKGLVFHYVPTSGDSTSGTPSLGTVMMATNYRCTDPAYTSKMQMLNEYFSSDSVPTATFIHPIECNPAENPYQIQYVRTGAVPSGEDQKTYDIGTMRLATQGCPVASTTLGELWVSYEVELKKPKPYGLESTDSGVAHYSFSGAATAAPYGTSRTLAVDTIGLTLTNASITFPRGCYGTYLILGWYLSTVTYTQPSTTLTGCSGKSLSLVGPNSNIFQAFTAITAQSGGPTFGTLVTISQTSTPASIVLSGGVITGSVTGDVIVTQISSNYV